MNRLNGFIFLATSIFLSSCGSIYKDSEIPVYIHIDHIDLTTNPTISGSDNHQITDAWVYIDDQFIGSYELPATFPIITSEGNHEVMITPGVKMNGISATRIQYPLFTSYSENIDLFLDSVVTMQPVVEYRDGISYEWMEDFEGGGDSWFKDEASDTNMLTTSVDSLVFEGGNSGHIFIPDSMTFFEIQTNQDFLLPFNGTPVFLELDHRSTTASTDEDNNHFLAVGLLAYKASTIIQTEPIVWINSKSDWNRTYINLTSAVSSHSDAFAFKIYLGTSKTEGSGDFEMFLDNIKLIHQ